MSVLSTAILGFSCTFVLNLGCSADSRLLVILLHMSACHRHSTIVSAVYEVVVHVDKVSVARLLQN